jgi:catechol 2,3-dioxygenase-like lactoylglutathione lyase family enzyme
VARVHHTAVCTADIETSLRFWRDGLGFEVLMDHRFEGDWQQLFAAPSNTLRSIFLGDPAEPESGILELVEFEETPGAATDDDRPNVGFFLVSVFTPLDAARERLEAAGFPIEREITVSDVRMAVARDPNGVLIELVDRDAMP